MQRRRGKKRIFVAWRPIRRRGRTRKARVPRDKCTGTRRSSIPEDWVVVCAVRYEPVSLLFGQYQGLFRKKQRSGRQECRKALQRRHFLSIPTIQYQGRTGSGPPGQTPSEQHPNGDPLRVSCDTRAVSWFGLVCGNVLIRRIRFSSPTHEQRSGFIVS
jgi:hypothetical protein